LLLCLSSIDLALTRSVPSQGLYLLWLKHFSSQFPANAPNTYPLGIQAVSITSNLIAGYYIDATQSRVLTGLVAAGLQLLSTILLLVPSTPNAGVIFAFYTAGTSYIVNPLLFGWVNIIGQWEGDEALRAVVLYAMNVSQSVLLTFWGVAFFPAGDAPRWTRGYAVMVGVCVGFVGMLGPAWQVSSPPLRLQ
jgi:MFS transporter, ACS family, pantothenate transporter